MRKCLHPNRKTGWPCEVCGRPVREIRAELGVGTPSGKGKRRENFKGRLSEKELILRLRRLRTAIDDLLGALAGEDK